MQDIHGGGGAWSYSSAEKQSVYSTVPADWAKDRCKKDEVSMRERKDLHKERKKKRRKIDVN